MISGGVRRSRHGRLPIRGIPHLFQHVQLSFSIRQLSENKTIQTLCSFRALSPPLVLVRGERCILHRTARLML